MGVISHFTRARAEARRARGKTGFTLTELMIVIGLVALLAALLLPVFARMRAAAGSVRCTANLRQMATAWAAYTADNEGRFVSYAFHASPSAGVAWSKYWPGVLDRSGLRGQSLLCPAALDPNPTDANMGFGSAATAWTGSVGTSGSCIRLDGANYREGSYGFNRYMSEGPFCGFPSPRMSTIRRPSEVPVFLDAAYVDTRPVNGSDTSPAAPPPNLTGATLGRTSPEHWLFLLARHGRGVNVATADGSVRWVAAEDTYTLCWNANWVKYRLELPGF